MDEPIEVPDAIVKMSKELIAILDDWSEPVQVKVVKLSDGTYSMVCRRYHGA